MHKKVTGIGGVFIKCDDPAAMRAWYAKHLGFSNDQYGTTFSYDGAVGEKAHSVWSTFAKDTTYFQPSVKDFMINFRVENLEWLLGELHKEGIEPVGEMQVYDYGKFAHIVDPEGNKIELWEPIDKAYAEMVGDNVTG